MTAIETTEAIGATERESAPILLNLGSGPHPLDGWTNLDINDGHDCCDLSAYADDSVDHVRASHVLEHMDRKGSARALTEWARVLKPGGSMSIAVPNLDWILANKGGDAVPGKLLEAFLFGGQMDSNDYHRTAWDTTKLTSAFRAVGLGAVRPWYSHVEDCAAMPVSLNLRATKMPFRLDRVRLCMTMPRHIFTRAHACVTIAIKDLGIDYVHNQGVFWHHGLDRLFCQSIEQGTDFILTADYDTIFTPGDILHLLDMADQFQLDAVFPLQAKRGTADEILARVVDDDGKPRERVEISELRKPLTRCGTGHFGLTLIRCAALKDVPTPWFAAGPNAEGHYGDGRVDEDIYFWHQWERAGKKLHMANDCHVGHLQEVITWANPDYTTGHQLTYDYDKGGKPAWTR